MKAHNGLFVVIPLVLIWIVALVILLVHEAIKLARIDRKRPRGFDVLPPS